MKLREIRIGEAYAVCLNKASYEDAEQEWTYFGVVDGLVGADSQPYYKKALVLDVGVPYKKGRHGVRIEFTYQRAHLAVDGETWTTWRTAETNRATVHYSILISQWDEFELRQAIREHERQQKLQERFQRQADQWLEGSD